jgi:hypothetical protein
MPIVGLRSRGFQDSRRPRCPTTRILCKRWTQNT